MENQFLRNEMLWGQDAQRRPGRIPCDLVRSGRCVGSYTAECPGPPRDWRADAGGSRHCGALHLNRQLEALHSTLGQAKAEAVAARLLDINPRSCRSTPLWPPMMPPTGMPFFPDGCRYDYIVDAIDLVSCKLDLRRPPAAADPYGDGSGHRQQSWTPTLLQLTDLQDLRLPLAQVMREELRNRGIEHLRVVFQPGGAHPRPGCTAGRRGPAAGSAEYPRQQSRVPATAGLLLGSAVVRDLIEKGRA